MPDGIRFVIYTVADGAPIVDVDDIPPALAIEWLAPNRFIVRTVGDEIRIYSLVQD